MIRFIFLSLLIPVMAIADCTKIGVLGEFSTTTSRTSYPYGQEIYRGLEIGKSLNTRKCFDLVKIDINNNIANIDGLIRKNAAELGIKFFIGLGTSEQAHAALNAIDATGSVLVTPTATDDELLARSKNIILLSPPNSELVKKIVQETKSRGIRKIALIYGGNNVYSQSMTKFFEDEAKKAGLEITYKAAIRIGRSTKIEGLDINKIKGADALFLPIFEHDVIKVLGHLYKQNALIKVIGTDSWGSDSKIISTLPDFVKKYILFSVTSYNPALEEVSGNSFYKTYLKRYGTTPMDIAAFSFEALNLLDQRTGKDALIEFEGTTGKVEVKGQITHRDIFVKAL